jgi:hypothetical protein
MHAFVSWLCAGRVKGLYNYFTGFTMPSVPLLHELFAGRFKELDKDSCAHQMKAVVSLFYTMHCQGSFN